MNLTEEQYARVAGWLDGQDVKLSAEERAVAEEVRRGEGYLTAMLGVPARHEALDRAGRRLAAELARPRRRALRIGRLAGAIAAAAAVVILAVTFLRSPPAERPAAPGADVYELAWDEFISEPSAAEEELDLLARQIDEVEAEMSISFPPSTMDVYIDALRGEIEEFWLDDLES